MKKILLCAFFSVGAHASNQTPSNHPPVSSPRTNRYIFPQGIKRSQTVTKPYRSQVLKPINPHAAVQHVASQNKHRSRVQTLIDQTKKAFEGSSSDLNKKLKNIVQTFFNQHYIAQATAPYSIKTLWNDPAIKVPYIDLAVDNAVNTYAALLKKYITDPSYAFYVEDSSGSKVRVIVKSAQKEIKVEFEFDTSTSLINDVTIAGASLMSTKRKDFQQMERSVYNLNLKDRTLLNIAKTFNGVLRQHNNQRKS